MGGALFSGAWSEAAVSWKHFRGMCDASAMEMLTDDLFVAANDEDNVLRVYSRAQEGFPVQNLDFTGFFGLSKRKQEIDFEGAARVGNRIYWISSHGANAKGKFEPSRHRLFATELMTSNGVPRLRPVGRLFPGLVRALMSEPAFASFHFGAASQKPPKDPGALNIEGLAATPEGHLLIGFRNPIPGGKALIIPLVNPAEVTAGKSPRFGKHRLLDLKGFGIRSITPHGKGYLIVAGPYQGDERSQLYEWDGGSNPEQITPRGLAGNPEAISIVNGPTGEILFVVSDDGTRKIGGKDCKKLKDWALKAFRGYELPLEPWTQANQGSDKR
jgi:hypothetical protein